jgi:hypothetical protein
MPRKMCAKHPNRESLPGFVPRVAMCRECWCRHNRWPIPPEFETFDVPPEFTASADEAFNGTR